MESLVLFIGVVYGNPASCIGFSHPVQPMGDLPSGSESSMSMDQCLMQLERRLQEQHYSHQQKLAAFLAANASLRDKNDALHNTTSVFPHPKATNHRVGVTIGRRSLVQSESMKNFSPLKCHPLRHEGLPWAKWTPSPRRSLDPALRALDDISVSPFILSILNQEALPHFSLSKFQMYNGL